MASTPSDGKREVASIQIGPEHCSRLDIIAERFQVSRAQANRWIIDSVDPLSFFPTSRTVSTVEQDLSMQTNGSER